MKTINLDEFKKDTTTIRINGEDYIIPEKVPLGTTLSLMEYLEKAQEKNMSTEDVKSVLKVLHELFKIYQPSLGYDKFSALFDMEYLMMLINYIYAGIDPATTRQLIQDSTVSANAAEEYIDTKKNINSEAGEQLTS